MKSPKLRTAPSPPDICQAHLNALSAAAFALAVGLVTLAPTAVAAAKPSKTDIAAQEKAASHAKAIAKTADHSHLEGVLILSRHGVRSPLKPISKLNEQTSATWPTWNVEPGYLTPRGRKLVVGMGGYYRERFLDEKLLSGDDAKDVKHTYVHANVIQRTVQTAAALAEGLHPSTTTTIHRLEPGEHDRLFYGEPIDNAMKAASFNGRISNDTKTLMKWLRPQLDLIENAIGTKNLFSNNLSGLQLAASMADSFMLEYCEGKPMNEVAFGKADKAQLMEMFKVLATDFDIQVRTPYVARQRMSNMVSHITSTMQQIAEGKAVDGAFGKADDKLYIIVGHDTTLSSVAGLLGLDWVLPDTGRNLCPPHGALVFELRSRSGKDAEKVNGPKHFVRVYYAAETLTQMHEDAKLSLKNPPAIAPIFVPGASIASKHFDCPLEDFVKVVNQKIDKSFVVPIEDGKY